MLLWAVGATKSYAAILAIKSGACSFQRKTNTYSFLLFFSAFFIFTIDTLQQNEREEFFLRLYIHFRL